MIFTRIRIENLYSFDDCDVDLTFKRRVKNSTIPFESLAGFDKFNYKRVCVISGANATGKTSLGRILRSFQVFLYGKQVPEDLFNGISNKKEPGILDIEFVAGNKLHRYYIAVSNKDTPDEIKYASVALRKSDSTDSARARLLSEKLTTVSIDKKPKMEDSQDWFYLLSNVSYKFHSSPSSVESLDKDLLFSVLKSFDTSIEAVLDLKNEDNASSGFQVIFKNGDSSLIDLSAGVTDAQRFSKGTFYAIKIADFLGVIRKNQNKQTTFYMDEQLAFSHPFVEVNLLNLMIQCLGKDSQLFFTTHNSDILDMDLPVHSYLFLKKEEDKTKVVQPELTFKKNDRSLLNAVQNNIFGSLPDITEMDKLLYD